MYGVGGALGIPSAGLDASYSNCRNGLNLGLGIILDFVCDVPYYGVKSGIHEGLNVEVAQVRVSKCLQLAQSECGLGLVVIDCQLGRPPERVRRTSSRRERFSSSQAPFRVTTCPMRPPVNAPTGAPIAAIYAAHAGNCTAVLTAKNYGMWR